MAELAASLRMRIGRLARSPALLRLARVVVGSPAGAIFAFAPGIRSYLSDPTTGSFGADGRSRRELMLAYLALQAGEAAEAIARLESLRDRKDSAFLLYRLADGYARARAAVRSVQLLEPETRRGGAALLAYGLADAYSRLGMWQQAVAAWSQVPADAHLDRWAAVRLARAHRLCGRPEVGLQLLADYDQDPVAAQEFRRLVAAQIDWSSALQPIVDTGVAAVQALTITPTSELFDGVRGYLGSEPGAVQEVVLKVNGEMVVTTSARGDATGSAEFSLSCQGLVDFVGAGDQISLEVEDGPILWDGAAALRLDCELASDVDTLLARVRDGWRFTKFGELRKPAGAEVKTVLLDLYEDVRQIVESDGVSRCYPAYGNLLGAVRGGDFIAGDIGGFDAMCLFAEETPRAVRDGFVSVCERLLGAGFHLKLEAWAVMIRRRHDDELFVDLNYAWFASGEGAATAELQLSFGWREAAVTSRAMLTDERTAFMHDRNLQVPGCAEAVLEQIYGAGWSVPDQGFRVAAGLIRNPQYLLDLDDALPVQKLDPERVEMRASLLERS